MFAINCSDPSRAVMGFRTEEWFRRTAQQTVAVGIALVMWVIVGLVLVPSARGADTFVDQYQNVASSNNTDSTAVFSIEGLEPSSDGEFPVFIYLVGTGEPFQSPIAQAVVEEMVDRGFVAANVHYPNANFGTCPQLSPKSRGVFNDQSETSAVSVLCDRSKADCRQGVVTAGNSQGSVLAMLSNDFDSRIRAAYGMGAGLQYFVIDLRACLAPDTRALPNQRLRIVNGEEDFFLGEGDPTSVDTSSFPFYLDEGDPEKVRAQSEELTGLSCESADTPFHCFRANGSGWYMVQASEIQDDTSGHCYMMSQGCNLTPGTRWRTGSDSWTLRANLDWMASLTGETQGGDGDGSGSGGGDSDETCLVQRFGAPEGLQRTLRRVRDRVLGLRAGRLLTSWYYRF